MASYLTDRYQCVKYLQHQSEKMLVPSGVPQGSVLGPLLFDVYINDVIKNISSQVLIYADDLKIFRHIINVEDCQILQEDIHTFENWSKSNTLPINFGKCFIMSLTNKSCKLSFNYTINLNILSRVDSFRDLGIMFDSKLTFSLHISNIIAEAFKSLGFIIRSSSSFNNIITFNTLYCAFVRSKLEYASIVWAPSAQFYIQSIEKIQRRFLKFLAFKIDANLPPRGLPQSDLLIRFGYNDLKTRQILQVPSTKYLNIKDYCRRTALHIVCEKGFQSIAKALIIRAGAEVNGRDLNGETPLHLACRNKQVECATILIKCGTVDPKTTDISGNTALHLACRQGLGATVRLLLNTYVDVGAKNIEGWTPLHLACMKNQLEIVRLLEAIGASVHDVNLTVKTSLHAACMGGDVEIITFLIEKGVFVDSRDIEGKTPLHYCASLGHYEATERLIEFGAQVNAADYFNNTPLHSVCKSGNLLILTLLLDSGAVLDVFGTLGKTPLHLACENGFHRGVQSLVASGANMYVLDANGRTPLEVSTTREIVEFLRNEIVIECGIPPIFNETQTN
ncbi:ankyrin-1-like [Zophobas morio]|uniref:ankyrin-1-like n=1 Tax=Zophobas morio TaxID=2755281 RepID=UPI0030832C43